MERFIKRLWLVSVVYETQGGVRSKGGYVVTEREGDDPREGPVALVQTYPGHVAVGTVAVLGPYTDPESWMEYYKQPPHHWDEPDADN